MVYHRSQSAALNAIYSGGVRLAQASYKVDAMNKEMTKQAKADEEILSFDVPDAVLERAGGAEQTFTLFYCTNQSSECGLRD